MTDPRWQTVRGGIGTAAEYEIGAAENALAALDSLEAENERLNNERDEYRLSHDALVTGRTYKELIARAEKAEAERDAAHVLRDATVKKYLEQRLAAEAEIERLREALLEIMQLGDERLSSYEEMAAYDEARAIARAALGGEE